MRKREDYDPLRAAHERAISATDHKDAQQEISQPPRPINMPHPQTREDGTASMDYLQRVALERNKHLNAEHPWYGSQHRIDADKQRASVHEEFKKGNSQPVEPHQPRKKLYFYEDLHREHSQRAEISEQGRSQPDPDPQRKKLHFYGDLKREQSQQAGEEKRQDESQSKKLIFFDDIHPSHGKGRTR